MQKFIPFVDTLIENIDKPNEIHKLNLILDSGGFNGSYHHGVLIYFNQLEQKQYVKINKISGSSIGSVCGMLYLLDLLDDAFDGHDIMRNAFKNTGDLSFAKKWLNSYNKKLKKDDYLKCNNRLFITYYNIITCKQIVISKYKSNAHLLVSFDVRIHNPHLIFCNPYFQNARYHTRFHQRGLDPVGAISSSFDVLPFSMGQVRPAITDCPKSLS